MPSVHHMVLLIREKGLNSFLCVVNFFFEIVPKVGATDSAKALKLKGQVLQDHFPPFISQLYKFITCKMSTLHIGEA